MTSTQPPEWWIEQETARRIRTIMRANTKAGCASPAWMYAWEKDQQPDAVDERMRELEAQYPDARYGDEPRKEGASRWPDGWRHTWWTSEDA